MILPHSLPTEKLCLCSVYLIYQNDSSILSRPFLKNPTIPLVAHITAPDTLCLRAQSFDWQAWPYLHTVCLLLTLAAHSL